MKAGQFITHLVPFNQFSLLFSLLREDTVVASTSRKPTTRSKRVFDVMAVGPLPLSGHRTITLVHQRRCRHVGNRTNVFWCFSLPSSSPISSPDHRTGALKSLARQDAPERQEGDGSGPGPPTSAPQEPQETETQKKAQKTKTFFSFCSERKQKRRFCEQLTPIWPNLRWTGALNVGQGDI